VVPSHWQAPLPPGGSRRAGFASSLELFMPEPTARPRGHGQCGSIRGWTSLQRFEPGYRCVGGWRPWVPDAVALQHVACNALSQFRGGSADLSRQRPCQNGWAADTALSRCCRAGRGAGHPSIQRPPLQSRCADSTPGRSRSPARRRPVDRGQGEPKALPWVRVPRSWKSGAARPPLPPVGSRRAL